MALQINTKIS